MKYSRREVKRAVWYTPTPVDSSLGQPNKFSTYLLLLLFLGWASSPSTPNNPQRNSTTNKTHIKGVVTRSVNSSVAGESSLSQTVPLISNGKHSAGSLWKGLQGYGASTGGATARPDTIVPN